MSVVQAARAGELAAALVRAADPQQIPLTQPRAGSTRTTVEVAPAIARLLTPADWRQRVAKVLRGDPKYALWTLAAHARERPAPHQILDAARAAAAGAGKYNRRRAEAALGVIERDPDGAYDRTLRLLEQTREETGEHAGSTEEMAGRLPPILRRATTVLDSAQAQTREQYDAEERACADTLATEWFLTVHTAAEPGTTNTLTEMVVKEVYRGRARQEVDHVHELVTLFYPVTRTAVVAWTRQRYGAADVEAQPVRSMKAAQEYIRRQSTNTTLTQYNRGVFSAGHRTTPVQGQAAQEVSVGRRVHIEADGVRTHPHIDQDYAQQQQDQLRTYAYAGRARQGERKANYAPYALVARGEKMPAGGYTLERAMERLPAGSPLFFSGRGEDVAAVEADRDIALASGAGLMPEMATLFLEREGAYVGDGVMPRESTQQVYGTLKTMAGVAGSLLRGVMPPEVQLDSVGGATADEVSASLSAVYMAREAALRMRRKEMESRVQISTANAPPYLQTAVSDLSLVPSGVRRTAINTGIYANDFSLLFDSTGDVEREAAAVFGPAGVFRMTGSTALLYEGQPALVFDSIQAVRHARNSARLGARVRIFRGTREEHERALTAHHASETAVSISAYPV